MYRFTRVGRLARVDRVRSSVDPRRCVPSLTTGYATFFCNMLTLALVYTTTSVYNIPLGAGKHKLGCLVVPTAGVRGFMTHTLIGAVLLVIVTFTTLLLTSLIHVLFMPLFRIGRFCNFALPHVLTRFNRAFSSTCHAKNRM